MSDEHFTVDGTLIEAWAGQKSFKEKGKKPPQGGGRNPSVDFHGEKRINDTHESTTDPESRMYKKAPGEKARLSYLGHALMENRNGLVVNTQVTQANGTAERDAALIMCDAIPGKHRIRRLDLREPRAPETGTDAPPHPLLAAGAPRGSHCKTRYPHAAEFRIEEKSRLRFAIRLARAGRRSLRGPRNGHPRRAAPTRPARTRPL